MKRLGYSIFLLACCLVLNSCSNKQYEVKFLGMNEEIIKVINVTNNDKITYPTAPNIEGYDFTGWDKKVEYVTSDVTITANYQIKRFTVKFYDNNNNVLETKVVNYNSSVEFDYTFNIDGHTFIGWDQDLSNIKSDLEVKPLFNKATYTVKFYDESNKLIHESIVAHGESATLPNELSKEGYNFIGWDKPLDYVTFNLEVYPVFEQITFSVCFYDELGNLIKEELVPYGEDAVGVTAPAKKGFRFIRWDESLENVKRNLAIYPIYEQYEFTVTFVGMYGEVLKVETVEGNASATAPAAPEVAYYTFYKWDLDFSKVTTNMTVKAIYNKTHTVYDISDVNYWLQILSSEYNINGTILSKEEIANYNSKIISTYSKTKVMDVLSISSTQTDSYVKGLITKYSNINKYTVYNESTNTSLSTSDKDVILANRDLTNIPSTVSVKYGIISDFAWMRSYPTNHYSNNYSMDRFQETSLNVGEGVAIYHESLDKEWYFVQAENYNGWVEKKYIAVCSYDELEAFLKPDKNLLITSDYVTLESSHVRMGQSFPLLNTTDSSYVLAFPTRDSDGKLVLKELEVAKSNDYNEGYLEYTYYNVFNQAFKLLGIDYSWGDKDKLGRDCSSTMNAIYKCFGFMMPRNTSNQVAIPTYGSSVSGLSNTSIQNYKPGTMIFTSSHVMLYIGEDENGTAYLLHNTNSGNGECILQSLNDYGGSRINGVLKLQ